MTKFLSKLKKGARQLLPSCLSATAAEKVEENMEKEIFEGRYTDESVVAQHLRAIFPGQKFQISVRNSINLLAGFTLSFVFRSADHEAWILQSERGRIFCNIPRKLTPVRMRYINLGGFSSELPV